MSEEGNGLTITETARGTETATKRDVEGKLWMPTLWGEWEEAAARCSADADADDADAAQEENGFDAAVDRGGDGDSDASEEKEASPCV
jgi:hypothetical protein